MLITRTTFEDIDNIKANKYFVNTKEMLKHSLKFQEVFTFKDGDIKAIVMFHKFCTNCFRCGVVLADDFNPHFLKHLKVWVEKQIKKHKCKRLETEGYCDKILYRFHKFMGFKEEVILNNGDYIKWVK